MKRKAGEWLKGLNDSDIEGKHTRAWIICVHLYFYAIHYADLQNVILSTVLYYTQMVQTVIVK